uniref:T. congolense-specific, cell surface-expressed gene family n=1 Tax=Trypanosoma congolense (strain IL3000) TaxID=1068625 RepID=G0USH3_TRYCI|nr:hypothetical protein, unlikely [Trypanosoma congolense IL3000]
MNMQTTTRKEGSERAGLFLFFPSFSLLFLFPFHGSSPSPVFPPSRVTHVTEHCIYRSLTTLPHLSHCLSSSHLLARPSPRRPGLTQWRREPAITATNSPPREAIIKG